MRKKIALLIILSVFCLLTNLYADNNSIVNESYTVQIVNLENTNLSTSELSWLPLQIQDKLNSNLQTYLKMKTIIDYKSEITLKTLQAASEDSGRDVNTAIEFGKITTAKYALFTKIRKTGSGYVISVDFTDLTTGENLASCLSKEYQKVEYLYGLTGAVDEVTVALADKLNIQISDSEKNILMFGSKNFSVEDKLYLSKQNESQYQQMIDEYDAELAKLFGKNDIESITEKKKLENEKTLLQEKLLFEKKIQDELISQKEKANDLKYKKSFGISTEGNMYSIKGLAPSAGIVLDFAASKKVSLGGKVSFTYDFLSKDHSIFTFETLGYLRIYLAPPEYNPTTGLFLEGQGGGMFLNINSDLKTTYVIGGSIGYRLGFNKFYIEPSIRGGYPFVVGIGISTGIRF